MREKSRFARSTIPEEKWGTTRGLSEGGYSGYQRLPQPRFQGSLLPALSHSVGRVGENPGNEVVVTTNTRPQRVFLRFKPALWWM